MLRWAAAFLWTGFIAATVIAPLVVWLGLGSILFSLALNQLLMIWVFIFFTLAHPPLDHPWLEPYFRIRPWERDGKRWLSVGVLPYQAVLKKFRLGVFGGMRPKDFRVTGDPAFLARMEGETKGAESAHLLCFLIVVGFAVYAVTNGQPAGAAWLLVTGIVTQVYPVMLQRYHRPRWRRARHTASAGLAMPTST